MQGTETQPGRVRRAVNDLVLAEMFLIQATIESAAAIGDSVGKLGRQLGTDEGSEREPLGELLQRTADGVVEPYATRFRYLRQLIDSEK